MMPTWERGVVYLDLPVVEIGEEVFQRVNACCVYVGHSCHYNQNVLTDHHNVFYYNH